MIVHNRSCLSDVTNFRVRANTVQGKQEFGFLNCLIVDQMCSNVLKTLSNFIKYPHHIDKSISNSIQVALRAVVLQPGVLWFGSRDWLVVSTILPQAPVQSGAGVESYSDASSGMAKIMPNEV
jgi:hypothetical protein